MWIWRWIIKRGWRRGRRDARGMGLFREVLGGGLVVVMYDMIHDA